jgi:hypothetical protein
MGGARIHLVQRLYLSLNFFYRKLGKKSVIDRGLDLDSSDKSPGIISLFSARALRRARNSAEKNRVREFKFRENLQEHRVVRDILKNSRRILFDLLVAVVISALLDWISTHYLHDIRNISELKRVLYLPSRADISTALITYIAAMSAFLGLIFALYAVGFQLISDRYSDRVTQFINSDPVSSYFFQFLVFTDLFAIVIYLKLILFKDLTIVSFAASTVFVALSILSILVFKNHYFVSIKPENTFNRLRAMITRRINDVTDKRSFKRKSWSVANYAKSQCKDYIKIIGLLYEDLVKNSQKDTNWSLAIYAPLVLGEVLRHYTSKKRFISSEKTWWSEERQERVPGSDLNAFTIKMNYEIQGRGPLFMSKPYSDWFEDSVLMLLKQMKSDVALDKSGKLFNYLCESYKQILVGDKEKQADAMPKTIPGAWQNQEFAIFQRTLADFISLWKELDVCEDDDSLDNFLNSIFVIGLELIEKWGVDLPLQFAEKFYDGNQLNRDKKFLHDKNLPAFYRQTLLDYWERLEVEQSTEDRIVTPKSELIKELRDIFLKKEKELTEENISKLFDCLDEVIEELTKCKNGKYEEISHFIKLEMEWISRMLYLDRSDLAEPFASKILNNSRYLFMLSGDQLAEQDFLEQIEKGFFVSLLSEKKGLFKAYSFAASIVLIRSLKPEDETNLSRFMRAPVIWGSLAFAMSELRQDKYWVITFVQTFEPFVQKGALGQLMDAAAKFRSTRNIGWETMRYLHWQRAMFNMIDKEVPKTSTQASANAFIFMETYDHPSKFIQGLGEYGDFVFNDRAIEAFAEWTQKRQALADLLAILLRMKGGDQNGQ